MATKIGHGLAKFFNIKLQQKEPYVDEVTRDGSVLSGGSNYPTDTFVEEPVTVGGYLHEITPDGHDIANYLKSLFPFLYWITKYNLIWFAGDLVAGEYCHDCLRRLQGIDDILRYHDRSYRRPTGYGIRETR